MNISNLKNDINVFKDETLKTLRGIEKQLLEKIKLKSIETETKIADFDLKLSKFQEINKRMYESVVEQQVYLEKIRNLNDFKSKTETKLISYDIKISHFLSDLLSIKSRYDKLFLENLTVPGIIGNSCKYHSISEYISDTVNMTNQLKGERDLIKKQVTELSEKNEFFEKTFKVSIDNSISECKLYTDVKINEIKNYFLQKIDEFNNILTNAKNQIEENVLKNEEISTSIKNEIKSTKNEVTILIEEKNKETEKIKNEIKKSQSNEIKKEISEIKRNFTELKLNMEKQIVNVYKLGKNKNIINSYNSSSISNNNIFLKKNNLLNEGKSRDNIGENEHIKITTNDKTDIHNKKKEIFAKQFNNNNNKNDNIISHLVNKNKNENTTENLIKEISNNIDKIETQEKYHIKVGGKNLLFKNKEASSNIKINKNQENKSSSLFPNQIANNVNNKEHKILMPENLKENKNDSVSYNKNIIKDNDIVSRNKSFSRISNNKLVLEGDTNILLEGSNTLTKNNNNKNSKEIKELKSIKERQKKEKTEREKKENIEKGKKEKEIQENEKIENEKIEKERKENEKERKENEKKVKANLLIEDKTNNNINNNHNYHNIFRNKPKTTKYVIHSIDAEISLSNFKRKISNSANNLKRNIVIKLMKNRLNSNRESKMSYLQQQFPTLNLYKEYFNKKMKEKKEKEKFGEIIKAPKKASPAFGRTAYIKFEIENNNINLKKNHNGNMNIAINDNIYKYIDKSKYFHTNSGEIKPVKTIKLKKRNKKNEEYLNLSV